MKQGLLAFVVAISVCSAAVAEDKMRYSAGLEKNGEVCLHVDYHPTPYNEGKTFEMMKSGEMDERYLPNFNEGGRFGKAAHMTVGTDLYVGQVKVPKGEYKAGLNVDTDGNFSFVVWMGEGDDAKPHGTPVELMEHEEAHFPSLCMFLMPGGEGEGSHLMVAYGNSFAMIPISEGGAAKPGSDSAKKKKS